MLTHGNYHKLLSISLLLIALIATGSEVDTARVRRRGGARIQKVSLIRKLLQKHVKEGSVRLVDGQNEHEGNSMQSKSFPRST